MMIMRMRVIMMGANQNKLGRKGVQEQLLGKVEFYKILKDLLGSAVVNVEEM